ncbi:MAG: hypothetical protein ABIP30_12230 [Ferruginibacter sp.]
MKLRDLFSIIVKIFGLWFIKDILLSIAYFISPLVTMITDRDSTEWGYLIISLIILGLYFPIAYTLLFKTSYVVDLLKLDPDFMEEKLTFQVSTRNVVSIALILLCGLILIDEIPNFIKYIYNYYQLSQIRFTTEKPETANIIISVVKIVIAFLLIGEREKIVQLILKEKTETIDEEETEGQ